MDTVEKKKDEGEKEEMSLFKWVITFLVLICLFVILTLIHPSLGMGLFTIVVMLVCFYELSNDINELKELFIAHNQKIIPQDSESVKTTEEGTEDAGN